MTLGQKVGSLKAKRANVLQQAQKLVCGLEKCTGRANSRHGFEKLS